MLFGIISELISRISWSFPLFYSVYLGKFTVTFMLDSRKETRSLASAGSKILGLSTLMIEQGLNDERAFLWYSSFILYENSKKGVLLIYHESIHLSNKLASCWSLYKWNITTLTYCIIQCYLLLLSFLPWLKTFMRIEVRDEKNWE